MTKDENRTRCRDDASTAEAARGRVEIDEQGEARRANTTPNGGPNLERGRLRLKTWSKSDFSIAETTWPTSLYTYIYVDILVQRNAQHTATCNRVVTITQLTMFLRSS